MSDDMLITLFQGGDPDTFRVLVQRYTERIRAMIHSILNDANIIDDLTQEVFIKAYQGLPAFRFDSSFFTWLYRITINRCRDEIRKKKFRRILSLHRLLENNDPELARRTSITPEDPDRSEFINKSLQQLPEKFRMPVILKDIEGLSYEEISQVLQCELGTVKSRLSRGRAMLRKKLQPLLEVQ